MKEFHHLLPCTPAELRQHTPCTCTLGNTLRGPLLCLLRPINGTHLGGVDLRHLAILDPPKQVARLVACSTECHVNGRRRESWEQKINHPTAGDSHIKLPHPGTHPPPAAGTIDNPPPIASTLGLYLPK